jgi:4,5-dihydroxyphthalate decarboxylase
MTASAWIRGFLQHNYGVQPKEMKWLAGYDVREIDMPKEAHIELINLGQRLDDLLEGGDIDALIPVIIPRPFLDGSRNIVRILPESHRVEID